MGEERVLLRRCILSLCVPNHLRHGRSSAPYRKDASKVASQAGKGTRIANQSWFQGMVQAVYREVRYVRLAFCHRPSRGY